MDVRGLIFEMNLSLLSILLGAGMCVPQIYGLVNPKRFHCRGEKVSAQRAAGRGADAAGDGVVGLQREWRGGRGFRGDEADVDGVVHRDGGGDMRLRAGFSRGARAGGAAGQADGGHGPLGGHGLALGHQRLGVCAGGGGPLVHGVAVAAAGW